MIRLLTPAPDGSRLAETFDPDHPGAFTELLRLDSSVQATARTATTDHRIDGVDIRCGENVVVCLAAAKRDPQTYENSNLYKPARSGPPPLTFGYCAHQHRSPLPRHTVETGPSCRRSPKGTPARRNTAESKWRVTSSLLDIASDESCLTSCRSPLLTSFSAALQDFPPRVHRRRFGSYPARRSD